MRKMDEMEMSINLKAVKWAWGYTILFLAIWFTYDYIQDKNLWISIFSIDNTKSCFNGYPILFEMEARER